MSYPTIKREIVSLSLKMLTVFLTVVLVVVFVTSSISSLYAISDGTCNVAVLPIEGIILPFSGITEHTELAISPRDVRSYITTAETEQGIEAIVFEINSPGGMPVAAEWVMEAIADTTLPSVALIGDVAASGGYMAASAADWIIASAMSDVGSIGVTMSYLEESSKNKNEGINFVELATGRFKDAGNPNKPLSDEERALFERQLQLVHDEFVQIVSQNRNLDIERVRQLADGSTLIGREAKEAGLVDEIGGRSAVRTRLATILDRPEDEIILCEYAPLTLI